MNSNSIIVTIGGSPVSLTWNNTAGGGDGTTWDNTASGTSDENGNSNAVSNPFQFFDGDSVTFAGARRGGRSRSPTRSRPSSTMVSSGTYNFTQRHDRRGRRITISNGNVTLSSKEHVFSGGTSVTLGSLTLPPPAARAGSGAGFDQQCGGANINNGGALNTSTLTLNNVTLNNTSAPAVTRSAR